MQSRTILVVLGAAALVGVGLCVTRRESASPATRQRTQLALQAAHTAALPHAAQESIEQPTSTDARATQTDADCTSSLREALHRGDADAIAAAKDKLIAWLGAEPARAQEILTRMRVESDVDLLDAMAEALGSDPALTQQHELVEAFLAMSSDPLAARRIAALSFLGEGVRGEEVERQFVSIALADADPLVRSGAVMALASQSTLDRSGRARMNVELLQVATSPDAGVRAPAVGSVSPRELTDSQVSQVEALLAGDSDASVRSAAVEVLGQVRACFRARVLSALERSFCHETDTAVRETTLVSLVQAGRSESLPALKRLSGVDPSLDAKVGSFISALEAGEVDMDAILEESARAEARGK